MGRRASSKKASKQVANSPTLAEKRRAAIAAFPPNGVYRTLREIEHVPPEVFRTCSTDGTVLEPVAMALGVSPTHGAVMDELGITPRHLQQAFLSGVNGSEMNGITAAMRFGNVLEMLHPGNDDIH